MPVRKIPKNYLVVTGLVATDKSEEMTAYEGHLERGFMKLLTFDTERVLKYEEQPVKIEFIDADGKKRSYTPDILVTYRDGTKPLLAEIKSRRYLKKNCKELKPKFRAALRYAKERGWRFKVYTEVEIVTPYLHNVEFLLGFRRMAVNKEDTALILQTLMKMRETTPNDLLLAITDDKMRRAFLIPSLWWLVSNLKIGTDLEESLTMRSPIWLPQV